MAGPFVTMAGGDILTYVRDAVAKTAVDKRSFLEQSAAVGGTPIAKDELAEVRALNAAADAIQYALTVGQQAKTQKKPAPEWVLRMASQARVALIEGPEET